MAYQPLDVVYAKQAEIKRGAAGGKGVRLIAALPLVGFLLGCLLSSAKPSGARGVAKLSRLPSRIKSPRPLRQAPRSLPADADTER